MSNKILNKSYLQSLPHIRKLETINRIIDDSIKDIEHCASNGSVSYIITIHNRHHMTLPADTTNDEYVNICMERFPECKVSFVENSGVKIDWS